VFNQHDISFDLGIFMKYYKHITGYLVFFIIERNIVVADKSK